MRPHLISTLLSVLLSVISAEIYEFDVGIPTDDDPAVEKLSIKKPQTRVAVGEGSRDEPGAPAGHGAEECRNLHFTQESCPTRLSDIHRSLTEEVNRERKDKELKLEVEWKGDVKERKPGEYIVRAKLGGSSRCYRYTIRDVDECRVEGVWRQQCHSSTECVNRNGSPSGPPTQNVLEVRGECLTARGVCEEIRAERRPSASPPSAEGICSAGMVGT